LIETTSKAGWAAEDSEEMLRDCARESAAKPNNVAVDATKILRRDISEPLLSLVTPSMPHSQTWQ
jgi:hypothetical protein